MPDEQPLQVEEVVAALSRDSACALVHLPSQQEVDLFTDIYNKREPWAIRTLFLDVPDHRVLREALALGFQLSSFPPGRGAPTYELRRNCLGNRAAAIKAILLAHLLPGVGGNDWLWITASEYDDRDVPPPSPPAVWPPLRTPAGR